MAGFEEIVAGLEAEWAQADADELGAEVADRTRGELARLPLVERLVPLLGRPVAVSLGPTLVVRGQLRGVGPDWLLMLEAGREAVVPMASASWIEGATRASAPLPGRVAARTRLTTVLRRLVLDRADVALTLADGSTTNGVLDRVGPDHLELAVVPAGEFRRAAAVTSVRLIPTTALLVVRRAL